MKAVISKQYGSPEVLQITEIEKPVPKENEILIKVVAASVTAADSMIRKGNPWFGRLFLGLLRPKHQIPGAGFAGVVESAGSKVERFQTGDKVFGESTEHFGTHAEYLCVPEDSVVTHLPAAMSFSTAATMCDGPLTSLNFLTKVASIKSGQKVLINGASGSLGTAAVLIAKQLGAEVTGVCSASNAEMVRSLGADRVIDYTERDFTHSGETWDLIYDTVGKSSFTRCKNVLTEEGAYISPVLSLSLLGHMMWTSIVGGKKAGFSATGLLPKSELLPMLDTLKGQFESGELTAIIEREYPLKDIVDAHHYVDTGHKKGNIVINIQDAA